jgi:hypothetical protein
LFVGCLAVVSRGQCRAQTPPDKALTSEVLQRSGIDSLFRFYEGYIGDQVRRNWSGTEPLTEGEKHQAELLAYVRADSLRRYALRYAAENLDADSLRRVLRCINGPIGSIPSFVLLSASQENGPMLNTFQVSALPAPRREDLLLLDSLSYLTHLGIESMKDLLRISLRLREAALPASARSNEAAKRELVMRMLGGGTADRQKEFYLQRLFWATSETNTTRQQQLLDFWASPLGQYYGFFMHQLIGEVLTTADKAIRMASTKP